MDAYDPATVFSSIDEGGRYAFGNQPRIALWNLARLAEAMLPLFDADTDSAVARATEVLDTYGEWFERRWRAGMLTKLGLTDAADDALLVDDLLALLRTHSVDWTSFFRALSIAARGDAEPVRSMFGDESTFEQWYERWCDARARDPRDDAAVAAAMDRVNPVYVPRNHKVEEALAAATAGDLDPFRQLVDIVSSPYEARPGCEGYAAPAPASFGRYRTFCGT
jgi:uncharacterized protein YdiU (UPF0061 family)